MDAVLQQLAVGRRPCDDAFFADGDAVCGFFKRLCVYDIDEEELCHEGSKEFCCEVFGCTNRFSSVMEFEMHYNTCHRYVCSVCHKVLPSPHLLDLHIEETHDSFFSLQAEHKPMYQCLVEDCRPRFNSAAERKDHCIKVHSFPSDFRWLMPPGNSQRRKKKSQPKRGKEVIIAEIEMQENSVPEPMKADVTDNTAALMEVSQMSPKKNQKNKTPKKKHGKKEATMDLESEGSFNAMDTLEDQASSGSHEVPSNKSTNAVTFKGFLPRNITANRTFLHRATSRGKEWHHKATSEPSPSSLEGNSLSADLRDSLLTDMEAA